jgi:3',5'-cyclic AMP phosphodiesterase CpdA
MRLAHCSDLHLLSHDGVRMSELANKRWIGAANLLTNRSRHYHVAAFDQMIDDMNAQGIEEILCTGDVTNLALEQEFQFARQKFDKLARGPEHVTVIPGNHDAYVAEGIAYFAKIFGPYHTSDPGWPAGWPIVRVRGELALVGVTTSRETAWFSAYGYVGDEQLARLREILEDPRIADTVRLVAIQLPPAVRRAKNPILGLHDQDEFARVIEECGADLVVHGHEHRDMFEAIGSTKVIGVASGTYEHDDPARTGRYRVYEIADGKIRSDLVRVWDREHNRFLSVESPI